VLKQLKKEVITEDRERFRPLIASKRDFKDFLEETEKLEKKQHIALKKEQDQLLSFVEKAKMDVDCAKSMIQQAKVDSSYLDRVHGKVKQVETNIKNFKLKERTAFEALVDEEEALEKELEAMAAKFDSFQEEKSAH